MGRYEDLIQEARQGNTEALDTLESEFSVSTLRDKAEQAGAFESKYKEAIPLVRKARLDELAGRLDEDLRSAISVDDFSDIDPDDLTLEMIQDRAKSQQESRQAQRLAVAQDAGFDSVEEYETALATVKQQKDQRKTGMESVAGGVAASSGGEPGGSIEPSRFETTHEAFKSGKESGQTDDVAMAGAVDALLSFQSEGSDSE